MILSEISLDPELIQKVRPELEMAAGIRTFGERGVPMNIAELSALYEAEHFTLFEFVNKFVRQYQVAPIYSLLKLVSVHLANAVERNEMPQLVLARNYARVAFETMLVLSEDIKRPERLDNTFRPSDEEINHFMAVIFVMASTTNFLVEEVSHRLIEARQEEEANVGGSV